MSKIPELTKDQIAELNNLIIDSPIFASVVSMMEFVHCPQSSGFEGPDTFSGCGKCFVCYCKNELVSETTPSN